MRLDHDLDVLPQGTPPRGPHRARGGGFDWRRFRKRALIVVIALAVVVSGTGVYLWKYVNDRYAETVIPGDKARVDDLPKAEALTGTRNILVLGSDSRDVLEPGQQDLPQFKRGDVRGQRSDSMMLIQLRDGGKSAIGLSFPRDLWVEIPGRSGKHKINASYSGGPNLVMDTIRNLTGLEIHHYVEVNYASFQKMVDAVRGLRLCVDRAYADRESGLYVEKPGCYNFDGNKALAYVRMRKSDPEGDFGRIKRQQTFIRAMMGKLKSIGFLADPRKVIDMANALSSGVKRDQNLSLGLVRTIASKLSGYGAANMDFRVVPSRNDSRGGASIVAMNEEQATALFDAMVKNEPLPPYGKTGQSLPEPGDVQLDLKNASGVKGAAGAWRDRLEDEGFRIRLTSTHETVRQVTQVACRPGAELKQQLLAERFPGSQQVQSVNLGRVVDCVVLLGLDHAAKALESPSPSASPAG